MSKIYHVLKVLFILMLILILGSFLFYNNAKKSHFNSNNNAILKWNHDNYQFLKDLIFYDPYQKDIVSRLDREQSDLKNLFYSLPQGLSNLTSRKEFYNSVFIYMVSKKIEGIDALVRTEFGTNAAFKDLVIIDKDKNIIYKYGTTGFTTDYYSATNGIEARFIGNLPAFIQKYNDPTMDYNLEIIVFMDPDSLLSVMKESNFPSFVSMNGQLYQNSPELTNILGQIKLDLKTEKDIDVGINVVKTYTVSFNNLNLAAFAVAYPARSLGSSVLMLLKVLLLIFILAVLIIFDRLIEKKLTRIHQSKMKRIERKSNPAADAQEDLEETKRLDWITHCIENTEGGKK
jgi:cbb3-type cytochrome oxidase subunit 3